MSKPHKQSILLIWTDRARLSMHERQTY